MAEKLKDFDGHPIREGFYLVQGRRDIICYIHQVDSKWKVSDVQNPIDSFIFSSGSYILCDDPMQYLIQQTERLTAKTKFIRKKIRERQSQLEQTAQQPQQLEPDAGEIDNPQTSEGISIYGGIPVGGEEH